ncbi:MAG TPA: GMC family oxidoreductase [Polyangiaceae bacterium]|nr:GMC family oxidoreductase [Polyangiaceae bacterium]
MEWDYVVVGGGSAGCVAAAGLARDPSVTVALLECGDRAEDHPETLTADGYKQAFVNDALMHQRFSEPQPGIGGRRIFLGSGRGMGGSGSINAMVYTRGAAEDFDAWGDGWRWRDVAPDFERVEEVLRVRSRPATSFTETCIAAAEEAGFRRSEDLNDGDLSGVLGYETMSYEGDTRRSSYVAFIKDHPRDNLTVITGARARELLVRDRTVEGVIYDRKGERQTAKVRREVILCAGALETPKLMMLSGIGPGEALRGQGIAVRHELREVGKNLQDHPNVTLFFLGGQTVDCRYPQLYGFHRVGESPQLAPKQADSCFVFYPARSSFREGMMRMLPAMILPPKVHRAGTLPHLMRRGIAKAFDQLAVQRLVARLYGIVVILGKPRSRGTLTLASDDPAEPPCLDPAYLADPADMETMVRGVSRARAIAAATPLRGWGNREVIPGGFGQGRKGTERFIRNNVMTTYHYAGTCRMGSDDASVVDRRLVVRGLRGLRVADASIMPVTPVSALNAPSMMIGYRAARLCLEDARASAA